jgi:glycosyltransferase involved in cell wall biosynthesis
MTGKRREAVPDRAPKRMFSTTSLIKAAADLLCLTPPAERWISMTPHSRRIAIVCQPWDNVAPENSSSIPLIAYQLARQLASHWHVSLYGRRGRGQKHQEAHGTNIVFTRLLVLQKPQSLIEVLFGIFACYRKVCVPYVLYYVYHFFYIFRVALKIRASKSDAVLVFNFVQFARIIKFFNPRAKIFLHMQCEWLTDFALASERRLPAVDLIFSCSDYITGRIKTRFPAIGARCHTVYNGVDTDLFHPAQEFPARADDTKRLLYVGRLSPEKGVHILIQAFKLVSQSHPSLKLDVVGAADAPKYIYSCPNLADPAIASLEKFYGNTLFDMVRRQLILRNRSYLNDLADELAGHDNIVFHGGLTQDKLADFYRHADVAVVPSVWHEPFGIPTIEAMACGVPVVATLSGGLPEIVEQGQTGILVARGDAIALARAIGQVLDNVALARAMGEAGRQRVVERFSWQVVSQRLADLINTAASLHEPAQTRS